MGRKPFVQPEVLEHASLTGLTLQSPVIGNDERCGPVFIDADSDGICRGIDTDDSNPNIQ